MTELEINKALALAIGWPKKRVSDYMTDDFVLITEWPEVGFVRRFDYRDWAVIGPIAEKYNAFPLHYQRQGGWISIATVGDAVNEAMSDTPQKAIALAVIGAKK